MLEFREDRLDLAEQIGIRSDARGEAGQYSRLLKNSASSLVRQKRFFDRTRRIRLSVSPSWSNVRRGDLTALVGACSGNRGWSVPRLAVRLSHLLRSTNPDT